MNPLLIRLAAAVVLVALGCSDRPEPTPVPAASTAIEVTDQAGRRVVLPAPARRIVSLAPSHTEIVFSIGAGDRLVGRTPACDHPAAAASVPPVGNLFPPDYERIVGATPDLVLMIDGQVDVRRRLEAQGLTVAVLQPRTLDQVADAMRLVGQMTGVDARKPVAAFEAALLAATRASSVKSPRVFYEIGVDPLFGAGPDSFIDDIIGRAGGRNALTAPGAWLRLTPEQLIAANPSVIITGSAARRDAVRAEPPAGWTVIDAVENGRVLAVPDADVFARPGPRVVEGLAWLSAALIGLE